MVDFAIFNKPTDAAPCKNAVIIVENGSAKKTSSFLVEIKYLVTLNQNKLFSADMNNSLSIM